jgi:NMD protein affecting ribosome stability and mRNA decay
MWAWENSRVEVAMNEPNEELCEKCGTGIDPNRRVDFTLKDGTRVCESCFVKGTEKVAQKKSDWSN